MICAGDCRFKEIFIDIIFSAGLGPVGKRGYYSGLLK
ncbi:MAG: hypothetical protein A4E71_01704 [Smithella sp. PtaU1.Bin162]|nr:MAG: hypothetical protein A4E71_01704 [Smithella sp. PtaU1.Bin162]